MIQHNLLRDKQELNEVLKREEDEKQLELLKRQSYRDGMRREEISRKKRKVEIINHIADSSYPLDKVYEEEKNLEKEEREKLEKIERLEEFKVEVGSNQSFDPIDFVYKEIWYDDKFGYTCSWTAAILKDFNSCQGMGYKPEYTWLRALKAATIYPQSLLE